MVATTIATIGAAAPSVFAVKMSATSIGSAAADFSYQMAIKQDIGEWNMTSTVSNLFFPSVVAAPLLGSAGEFTLNDGFEKSTIFGNRNQQYLEINR